MASNDPRGGPGGGDPRAGRAGAVTRYRDLLATYVAPQWPRVAALALLLLGNIGLQLVNPQLLRQYIDTATSGGDPQALTGAAVLFLGLVFLGQGCAVLATTLSQNVAWTATNRLRSDLARHCLSLDLSFHHAHTPGQLVERIDGDVSTLANFFAQLVLRVLANGLLLLGVLAVLAVADWRLGLAFAGFAVAALAALYRLRALPVPHLQAARQTSAELYGFLEERLGGTEDLRANGITDHAVRGLHDALRRHLVATRRATGFATLPSLVMFCLLGLGEVLTFGLGGVLFTSGAISIGTLYMASYFAGIVLWPLRQIIEQLQDLQKAGVSLRRIDELARTPSRVRDGPRRDLPPGALAVELDRVSFAYGDGDDVLHDVSFRLAPGKVLGILGRTGSGKSTIARLLVRFYDPRTGSVRLGGLDARQLRLEALRRRVGLVTQEVQLIHASVRDNLAFFGRGVPDARILAVLHELGLGRWYASLPAGLDTELAAGGAGGPAGLSAGEAQLLAFARVFLADPGLVVQDEATSRLDAATEGLVQRAVERLLRGRTAILIAHRLETVRRADEILVLEQGHVVEHDTRERLLADPGSRFARLLRAGLVTLDDAGITAGIAGAAQGGRV